MFNFAWPWVFLLLPLPWVIKNILPIATNLQTTALRVPFFDTLKKLPPQRLNFKSHFISWRQLIVYLIWVLLVIALSGPQWLGEPMTISRTGRDLILAIDLSGSMQTPDMNLNGKASSRLAIVKQVANEFIENRIGDRIGLIVFGSNAYLQTPLTFDRKTVQDMLDDTSIGLAGPQTAIGDALGLAIKRLMQYPAQSRAIILLTDGGNNTGTVTPLAVAKLAQQQDIKIYTIGIGADQMTVPSLFGTQVVNPSADLDIESLQDIAKMTGGVFYRAKDGGDLKNIYASIDKLEPVIGDKQQLRPTKPLYPWPLSLALLLSILLTWRYIINKEVTHV